MESSTRTRSFESDRYKIQLGPIQEESPFPSFAKPVIVGCFSLDDNRKYYEGPVYLKFCKVPEIDRKHVRFDLNRNLEACIRDETSEELSMSETSELTHLLDWIHRHQQRFERRRPKFVLYRGLLTKFLGTPYETRENWKIAAMLKNGTIYLRNMETSDSIENRKRQRSDSKLQRFSAWGYNFENYMLSDSPLSNPTPHKNASTECNMVFQTRLGSHDLLYAAEIDGVLCKPGNDCNIRKHPELLSDAQLLELKTTRMFPHGKMSMNFRRYQLRKWWCQTFTVGISNVIAGLRDDEGLVHELWNLPVKSLSQDRVDWAPNICFSFVEIFLTEIKRIVGKDESSVYVFEFFPQRQNRGVITIEVTVEKDSDKLLPNLV